jgi:hypothetical protein
VQGKSQQQILSRIGGYWSVCFRLYVLVPSLVLIIWKYGPDFSSFFFSGIDSGDSNQTVLWFSLDHISRFFRPMCVLMTRIQNRFHRQSLDRHQFEKGGRFTESGSVDLCHSTNLKFNPFPFCLFWRNLKFSYCRILSLTAMLLRQIASTAGTVASKIIYFDITNTIIYSMAILVLMQKKFIFQTFNILQQKT